MAKILAVGDIHCSTKTIQEVNLLKQKLINKIAEIKPDALVILGDMSDTFEKVHVSAFNTIYSFLSDVSKIINVFYIVGNHDAINNQIFMSDDHFFNGFDIKGLTVIDRSQIVNIKDRRFIMCPYVPNGRFSEAINMCLNDTPVEVFDAVFCHQEFKGCQMGAVISTSGDDIDIKIPIISGHIHDRQIIENVIYVGTPYFTSFGDSGTKTISFFEFEETGLKEKLIDLNMPKKISMKISCEEFTKMPDIYDNNKYRITIVDTEEEILKIKKTEKFNKIKNIAKIVLKPIPSVRIVSEFGSKLTYNDVISKLLEKESESVKLTYEEVIRNAN